MLVLLDSCTDACLVVLGRLSFFASCSGTFLVLVLVVLVLSSVLVHVAVLVLAVVLNVSSCTGPPFLSYQLYWSLLLVGYWWESLEAGNCHLIRRARFLPVINRAPPIAEGY